jgi:hypothetical protein
MIPIRPVASALMLVAVGACAPKSTVSSPSTGPSRWTGTFRQSQSATSSVIGPATPGKGAAYGTITAVPLPTGTTGNRIELSISTPLASGTQIAWAVFSGPCGSPTPPLAGPQEFPTIEVTSTGAGFVRAQMSFLLDTRGVYHANVYWSSRVSDVSNVMMCANLAESR